MKKWLLQLLSDQRTVTDSRVRETEAEPEWLASIGYKKLERRRVLSATFLFENGLLTLDDFDSGQDLTFSQEQSDLGEVFQFEIEQGSFIESSEPNPQIIHGQGMLSVPTELITDGINIDGNNSISITQAPGIGQFSVSKLGLSNFEIVDQSLQLDSHGTVEIEDVSVDDANPSDTSNVQVAVLAESIIVRGLLANLSTNADAGITLDATRLDGSIVAEDASIQTVSGDIRLVASGQIAIAELSSSFTVVTAGGFGEIELQADSILMGEDSLVDGAFGNILVSANGSGPSSLTLGTITTSGDIQALAGGSIVDGTFSESSNLTGDQVVLAGDSIGEFDDIEIDANGLSFNSHGVVQLSDVSGGVVVNDESSAGGGFLLANSPLTISADISLTSSFVFTAEDLTAPGDTILVNNSAIVLLTATTNEVLELVAGDDIVFDTGSIVTGGGGTHTVALTADNEGTLDADRGSVTNSLGSTISVSSNELIIVAADGVGTTGNGLRLDVDSISVENTSLGNVFLIESNGLIVNDLINAGRDIGLAANGFVQIDGMVQASDLRLLSQGDVSQTPGSELLIDRLGVRQLGVDINSENDLDANNQFDIRLDQENSIGVVAASNAFDGGGIALNVTSDLVVGAVPSQMIGQGVGFAFTRGLTTVSTDAPLSGPSDNDSGDILISSNGFLQFDESVIAGSGNSDVRLIANGDVSQSLDGFIFANEIGIRQESVGDIHLCANNDLDLVAAFNTSGNIAVADVDEFAVGTVSAQTIGGISFLETSGANGSDILLSSAESLQLDVPIGAVASNVFLIANGDIVQQSGANIVANQLGIRQEATSLQSSADMDGNSRFDVLLADNNNVNSLAVFNAFDTGVVVFNEINDLAIGEINERTFCNGTVFHQTTGLSTNFSGPAIQGGGDLVDGDLLIQTGGSLQIETLIAGGSGNSDVRLVANGLVQQVSTTLLLANELGVRQESTVSGNVVLAGFNDVDIIAVGNSAEGGFIAFRDIDNLVVDEVSSQSISGIEFANTVGLESTFSGARLTGSADNNLGDIVINVGGFLRLEQTVDAANADVFLTSEGDISQSTGTPIFSNELGAIQERAIFDSDGDFDTDSSFVINLLAQNQIDVFGSTNALFAGNIQFKNSTGFSINEIPSQNPGVSFSGTNGIESNDGDVFLISAGYLNLESSLQSEAGAVRLLSAGDIHQTTTSVVIAGQLGVRQEATTLASNGDIDTNNRFDVILDGFSDIDELAIENRFETGVVAFRNLSGLTIGEVSAVLAQGNLFTDTSGIVSTFAGPGITGSGDSVHGDIVIEAGGFVQITHTIDAGAADVRISSSGDVLQSTNGILVANEFGVVQSGNNVNVNSDQDGNNSLDVHLTWQNTVDLFAAENSFAGGDVIFNNVQGLVVDAVSSLAIDDSSFVGVEGIATLSGDVFLNSNGFLSLEETVDAGDAVVRLLANGDVIQSANGAINAGSLGIRQEGMDANSETDVDSNGRLDIIFDDGNQNDIFGAVNAFDNGRIVFRNIPGLTIGAVPNLVFSDIAFSQTIGIEGQADILIQSAGFLNITQNVSASSGNSDIRLIALGDVVQDIDATIAANHLGIRQLGEQVVAAGDLDSNGDYDIHLCAPNLVSVFAATNSIGDVYFANNQDLVVGAVTSQLIGSIGFAFTSGVDAGEDSGIQVQSGNLQISSSITVTNSTLLQSAGFLSIDAETNANEVRLVAEGEIVQSTSGTIITSFLGVRQQGLNATPATDVDSNGSLDVILDDANEIATLAASNEFPGGVIALNNIGDLTIGSISEFAFGNKFFAQTTGVNGSGDVLLQTSGSLGIANSIIADNGNADVRLITSGNVSQDANAIIVADGLGVRQTSNGDVVLNSVNLVNTFSAFNPNGEVHFTNGQDLLIGTVGEQTIGNITFPTTSGTFGTEVVIQVTDGDLAVEDVITVVDGDVLLLQSGGSIQIDSTLTSPEIRLVANGDIFQTANGVITAGLLGVRQEDVVLTDAGDPDSNNQFDIILDDGNRVDTVAISNVFDGGVIAFNNETGFTVDTVSEFAFDSLAFAETTGVVSRGDIFLQSGGYLNLAEVTSADTGEADVLLIAIGDVLQESNGIITANELGIRIQAGSFVSENDLDNSGFFDIVLDSLNVVNVFGALNPNHDVSFTNDQTLSIGSVDGQSVGNLDFQSTTGITAENDIGIENLNGILDVSGSVSALANLLLRSAGSVSVNASVISDASMLVGNGDIVQSSMGTFTSRLLAIRQEGTVANSLSDLDNNNRFEVILDDANDIDVLAAFNSFDGGVVALNDIDDLTIGSANGFTFANKTFAATTGISTELADVLFQVGGFLNIESPVDSGADIRLVAKGDVVQAAQGILIANELGIRQASDIVSSSNDLDDNDRHDIVLEAANQIHIFAAFNSIGDVFFSNQQDLVIDNVGGQTIGNIEFELTGNTVAGNNVKIQVLAGNLDVSSDVTAEGESLQLDSSGSVTLNQQVSSDNVRLISSGDIVQAADGAIIASVLGIRQTADLVGSTADLDSNGRFDVVLDALNDVDVLAVNNSFNSGILVFSDADDLTIGSAAQVTLGDSTFTAATGLVTSYEAPGGLSSADSVEGDILVQTNGFLRIENSILAGNGIDGVGGNSDLRLIANGEITQAATGTINAQEFGIRQNNLSGVFNILLDQSNDVAVVSGQNVSDGGFIVFNDFDSVSSANTGLIIGSISHQAIGDVAFDQVDGLSTVFSGSADTGSDDSDLGDVLVVSNGFLGVNAPINAGAGASDLRIIANGDIVQNDNAPVVANELGILQAASALDSADDFNGDSKHSVEFGGGDGALFVNDVDTLSILNQENEGDILFRDVDDIVIERISSQSLGSVIFRGFNGVVSDDFSTGDNGQDGDGEIVLEALTSLSDGQDIIVATGGSALLRGDAQILLSDQLGDQLQIGGNVLFRSADIDVGQDGDIAGSSNNVRLGSITVNDLGFAGSTADITEDDTTVLTSQTLLGSIDNQASLLVLTSGGSITNLVETVMRFDKVQLNATTGNIFIGNQTDDQFSGLGGSEIELGLNAINASIDSEGSIEINGMVPVIENNANDASLIDNFGTNVGESLFIRSAGHIEQVVGVLEATQVGLNASEHVFLELVGASNEMVAIYAGEARFDSDLPNHQSLLEQLASIEGSDVHSDLVQSVSIRHQGDLVVGAVSNPDENGFLTTATGVTSNAENSGSIFLTGEDSLTISHDVSANASNSLPQVTVFVESENAENNNGSQISFANGATINVNGNRNGESNVGIVNSGQTVAFFGIDTDNNGAIDTFFFDSNQNGFMDAGERVFDTTTIISLGVSGTAPQFFEAVYGNPGESGYRFAFVFDSERRFNSIVAPEVPNLYTTNEFAESERFDVSFLEQLAPFAPFTVPGSDLEFQTALIEQMSNLNGRFNFNTIFEKVDPWTRDAITARTDNPLVFTVIEVRNDQDINLFVGQDADNGLNSVSQTLVARIENVGLRPTAPSFTFVENDIPEIVFPRFIAGQIPIIIEAESPELKVFEKPGTLSWIAVRIDDPEDIEDVDGELILKKPLVDYEPLSPNESPKQLEGVSRNQYEEIISQIEADPDAEVGLWYKIFLEQGNESKKEDELLFYYYKTGKEQEQRIEPESDFRSDSSTDALNQPELEQINPAEFDQSSDGTEQPSEPVLIAPANSDDVVSEAQQQEDIKERRSFANVSNGLLVAALVVNSRQKSESHDLQCHQSNASQFNKLNSLKRQLTDLIESSGG